MDYTGIIALLSIFVVAPIIVFGFIYMSKHDKVRLEELRIKRQMLELEVEKEKAHTRLLEAESAKYDRIIEDGGKGV